MTLSFEFEFALAIGIASFILYYITSFGDAIVIIAAVPSFLAVIHRVININPRDSRRDRSMSFMTAGNILEVIFTRFTVLNYPPHPPPSSIKRWISKRS